MGKLGKYLGNTWRKPENRSFWALDMELMRSLWEWISAWPIYVGNLKGIVMENIGMSHCDLFGKMHGIRSCTETICVACGV
jgi:hypothetical protein